MGLFSLPKILFTILAIIAVWQGFKWLQRRQTLVSQRAHEDMDSESAKLKDDINEMVACPDCGVYVAKDAGHRCT